MTQASYTAWDGNLYEWPPPTGWYESPDGKWWPEGYGPNADANAPSDVASPESGPGSETAGPGNVGQPEGHDSETGFRPAADVTSILPAGGVSSFATNEDEREAAESQRPIYDELPPIDDVFGLFDDDDDDEEEEEDDNADTDDDSSDAGTDIEDDDADIDGTDADAPEVGEVAEAETLPDAVIAIDGDDESQAEAGSTSDHGELTHQGRLAEPDQQVGYEDHDVEDHDVEDHDVEDDVEDHDVDSGHRDADPGATVVVEPAPYPPEGAGAPPAAATVDYGVTSALPTELAGALGQDVPASATQTGPGSDTVFAPHDNADATRAIVGVDDATSVGLDVGYHEHHREDDLEEYEPVRSKWPIVVGGLLLLAMVGGIVFLFLNASNGDDGVVDEAQSSDAPDPASTEPGSVAAPYEFGTGVVVFYETETGVGQNRWVIQVLEPVSDQTAELTGQGVGAPDDGEVLAASRVRITYQSGPDDGSLADLRLDAATSAESLFSAIEGCGADGLDTAAVLPAGGAVEGTACWAIPADQLQTVALAITAGPAEGSVYMALR